MHTASWGIMCDVLRVYIYVRAGTYRIQTYLLFWTLGRECAQTLGEGTPLWGWGAQGPQWGTMSISWVWTGEERRRSKMSENEEDSSFITASRNDHAQSKSHCASGDNSVTYPLQELCFIVLLFQENKSFGASTICIHPLMYVKPCREQFIFSGTPEHKQPTDNKMRKAARTRKATERKWTKSRVKATRKLSACTDAKEGPKVVLRQPANCWLVPMPRKDQKSC